MNKAVDGRRMGRQLSELLPGPMSTDMAVRIPVIWGTDAVHGHNNVRGATLFPHNIGLGAANDPDLIRRIGRATAQQVRATGITWVFAPTSPSAEPPLGPDLRELFQRPRDRRPLRRRRWSRACRASWLDRRSVVATAKHYLGDGGTFDGVDQGETRATRADMIRTHGAGYYAALDAGVQTVMASYNSWNDRPTGTDYGKMHGSREL